MAAATIGAAASIAARTANIVARTSSGVRCLRA
jgi:hypothetical protein